MSWISDFHNVFSVFSFPSEGCVWSVTYYRWSCEHMFVYIFIYMQRRGQVRLLCCVARCQSCCKEKWLRTCKVLIRGLTHTQDRCREAAKSRGRASSCLRVRSACQWELYFAALQCLAEMAKCRRYSHQSQAGQEHCWCPQHLTRSCLSSGRWVCALGGPSQPRMWELQEHGTAAGTRNAVLECWVPNTLNTMSTVLQPELVAEGPVLW